MFFILIDDINSGSRQYIEGELLNMLEMAALLSECGYARSYVFATERAALEWNEEQE